ncbi:hypothetical protein BDP27DRAFT_1363435 [Rhodocollybia butyracea]|uniref:Uncharacterized protein n=1 Tax=Rhodocollybia butyracea TaxID=206335 RepID=A0A9P5PNU6_9AGAR|nr:hypothetical protein BDP27DRAFT_1363435 [Rhodocollybia butyracea]
MPLRDFFSKKNKSRSDFGEPIPTSPTITAAESPTSEHSRRTLHPDDALLSSPTKSTNSSVYPSVAASPGSSSKLRLFGRRKVAKSIASSSEVSLQPPPPFSNRLSTSIASEADSAEIRRNLGPPPSRSAIFSAYADPHSASSTRSLPTEYPTSTETLPVPKRPLFPWSSKSQPNTTKKPKPKPPPPRVEDISAALEDDSSFNLKGFRHLRAPSPELPPPPAGRRDSVTDSLNSSSASLVPPRPIPGSRSRNSSIGSLNDPSASQQRISVAAFREAQARRSQAGSPVPGPRSPSPGPNLSHHRSPTSNALDVRQRTTSLVALGKAISSEEEDLSSEEDDDSDSDKRVKSKKSILKSKAKSEIGHGSSSSSYKPSPSTFPVSGTSLRPNAAVNTATPRSQSAVYPVTHPNLNGIAASASTGALGSRTAALRAPPQVRSATLPRLLPSDSDSDDSDDAPLATLVPPKRPGSAASNRSNPHSDSVSVHSMGRAGGGAMRARVGSNPMPKPLIDITELTGPNKRSPDIAGKAKSQEGFTGGATLLSASTTQSASSTKVVSPTPSSVTSTSPPGRRFVSPPPSPTLAHRKPDSTSPQMLSQLPAGLVQRRIPIGRKDTDALSMVSSTASSNDGSGGSAGKKKDLLSERLSKVVAQGATSSPNMQDSYPLRRSTADTTGRPSSDVLDVLRTSSPSPMLEKLRPGHRSDWSNGDVDLSETVSTPASASPASFSKPVPRPKSLARKSVELRKSEDSGTMEDLAALLGAGIKLVSVNGEDQPDMDLPFGNEGGSAETEELSEPRSLARLAYDPPPSPNRITPIVVKTRPANPSFSVTSRPTHGRGASLNIISMTSDTIVDSVTTTATTTTTTTATRTRGPPSPDAPRPRSTTLLSGGPSKPSPSNPPMRPGPSILLAKPSTPNVSDMPSSPTADSEASSTSSASTGSGKSGSGNASSGYGSEPSQTGAQPRQRLAVSKPPPRSMSANQMPSVVPSQTSRFPGPIPIKPFAKSQSPASSTGGSSSANGAPNTPRDGSDIGDSIAHKPFQEEKWGSGVSGLSFGAKHSRRKSIAFEDEVGSVAGNGKNKETPRDGEARRKERRRSEARAAIELGNTINGPGPILDDDDDEDLPISQTAAARMNGMNPMMMNPSMPGMLAPQTTGSPMWGWPAMPQMPQMPGQMLSPSQFMVPPPADPAFFAAHQQAMMFAKQAYQMAVAQQAMAAAADEWERGSTIGFNSSQSMYGMPPSAPSMMGSPYGMGAGNGWSTGSTIFPPSGSRMSMYGSGAMSEYGGGGGRGGNWNSSRSVYGESFGPSSSSPSGRGGQSPNTPNRGRMSSYTRDSGYFPPVPPIPPQANKNAATTKQSINPRARTVSQPAQSARHHDTGDRSPGRRAPPSSWKTNGG